jgi:hypothetical protein
MIGAMVARQAVEEARSREQQQPSDQYSAAAEYVSGAAAEQHEAGEGKQVAIDNPGQAGGGKAEVPTDRRQGDVHDRGVQNHHELAGAHQREDDPGGAGTRPGPPRRGAVSIGVLMLAMSSFVHAVIHAG